MGGRLFVYGSLRRGGSNHALLTRAAFLGRAATPPAYTLVDLGRYPGLLDGGSTSVRGEVFAVDTPTLARIDLLEEHPEVYVRRPLVLAPFGEVLTYFIRAELATGAPVVTSGEWPRGR